MMQAYFNRNLVEKCNLKYDIIVSYGELPGKTNFVQSGLK